MSLAEAYTWLFFFAFLSILLALALIAEGRRRDAEIYAGFDKLFEKDSSAEEEMGPVEEGTEPNPAGKDKWDESIRILYPGGSARAIATGTSPVERSDRNPGSCGQEEASEPVGR